VIDNLFNFSRILILAGISFWLAIFLTPALTHFLYKYKLGKKVWRENAPIFAKLHQHKEGTPTMGGILIWGTTLIVIIVFWLLAQIWPQTFNQLNFLTRKETILPLGVLIIAAIVGLVDDLLGIWGQKKRGLRMWHRLFLIYPAIAGFGAWWFYSKLDWDVIQIPFYGILHIGWWYIPLFIFTIVATAFSVNETDGLDGLAGGVLAIAFASYGVIAFIQGKIDLAVFCGVIGGALLAFLWFNIHPARFFMGDTGSMSLGVCLGVIAMLTNAFLLLPLIGFILVIESGSVLLQLSSKKLRHGKKIFLSSPLHHHFQAKGWPETKITQRFWIIAGVMAAIGLAIGLLGL